MEAINVPLNKAQLELLKLFSRVHSDEELMDLKRLFTQYYAERLMDKVDKLWDEKGYTQADMDRMANSVS